MNRVVQKTYDIVVIGGGPGGIPAAVAAARRGHKVLLVERNSFLGGAATSGLGILGYLDRQGKKALGGTGADGSAGGDARSDGTFSLPGTQLDQSDFSGMLQDRGSGDVPRGRS